MYHIKIFHCLTRTIYIIAGLQFVIVTDAATARGFTMPTSGTTSGWPTFAVAD